MRKERNYKSAIVVLVLAVCVLLLAYGYAVKTEGTSGGRAEPNALAEFKIAKGGVPILLPVRFNDKEYLFMFDTGTSHTSFDLSLRDKLGKAKRIEKAYTLGGLMKAELFDAPDANLGPFNLKDSREVICVDLTMYSLAAGKTIGGFIGMNFLRNYVIQIDFDMGKLLFLEPISRQEDAQDLGEELAIYYDSLGWPRIVANMPDGIKVGFIIDTGDDSTGVLDSRIFEAMISKRQIKTCETLAATGAGAIRQREARIGNLSIGSFEYQNLIFAEAITCSLGLPFLSRHKVTFDFPNGRVYFKKGREFNKIDETDMSGLHLLRISGKTVVYSVDEDSPAHRAGIRANDIILRVENKDASEYGMWKLRRLLMSGDKKKVMITIKRADEVKEVSFLLKKKI
jgi:hypothetical protein